MDFRTLQGYVTASPFKSFRLVMTDGRAYEVRHSNMLWPGRTTAIVGIPENPTEPDVYDRFVSVAMLHIVRIEPLDVSALSAP